MIAPGVTAWMKEFRKGVCFWIDSRQVSPFVKITIDASQREVIKTIAATMYLRNDVLYVKSSER
jgi:hypothetical protein